LIILYVIIIVGFLLKTSSNDANFIPKIFIDLEQFSVKEKMKNVDALFIGINGVLNFLFPIQPFSDILCFPFKEKYLSSIHICIWQIIYSHGNLKFDKETDTLYKYERPAS
jgi:hypothetical protein